MAKTVFVFKDNDGDYVVTDDRNVAEGSLGLSFVAKAVEYFGGLQNALDELCTGQNWAIASGEATAEAAEVVAGYEYIGEFQVAA